ncbi:hypothetical protein LTS15_010378 [Exophiala xenobiotica]|nr:hypothetical protein LTS15_010378 [Exophiala xenobiotica]
MEAHGQLSSGLGLGVVIGICLGGGLLRSGHLENFRIYCYAVGTGLYHNPPPRELQLTLTLSEKLNRLDWIGYLLFVPGLVLFCVGLSYHKNPYQFSNARVLGPFIVGIGLSVAFFIYEWRFTKHGVLAHGFFKHRNYALALLNAFVEKQSKTQTNF